MLYIRLVGILLTALLAATTAEAYVGFGVCNFGDQKVDSVICYGPAVLKQTSIAGDLKVAGTLDAQRITTQAMSVEGAAKVSDSDIAGNASVTGNLTATKVNFQKDLSVTGNNIFFSNTSIKGTVTVNSSNSAPYVVMQCGTIIRGAVIFAGKAGVVQITGDSIVAGKIKNGAMEFIKATC